MKCNVDEWPRSPFQHFVGLQNFSTLIDFFVFSGQESQAKRERAEEIADVIMPAAFPMNQYVSSRSIDLEPLRDQKK
jgi:hypothetical protein